MNKISEKKLKEKNNLNDQNKQEKNEEIKDENDSVKEEVKNDNEVDVETKADTGDNKIIKEKDKEIAQLKELLIRRQADFENYKKRSIKNAETDKKLAIKDIALDIMNIHDDLIRASDAASNISQDDSLEKAHEAYVEGVIMISRNIEKVLGKYGIEEIEAINIPFDPNIHEAVEFNIEENVDCDTVTKVYQKGFKFDEFVIRSSKVRVSKPAPVSDKEGENIEENTNKDEEENNN